MFCCTWVVGCQIFVQCMLWSGRFILIESVCHLPGLQNKIDQGLRNSWIFRKSHKCSSSMQKRQKLKGVGKPSCLPIWCYNDFKILSLSRINPNVLFRLFIDFYILRISLSYCLISSVNFNIFSVDVKQ